MFCSTQGTHKLAGCAPLHHFSKPGVTSMHNIQAEMQPAHRQHQAAHLCCQASYMPTAHMDSKQPAQGQHDACAAGCSRASTTHLAS